jgi:16S rRNA (cytidine1402-2'-O)-methyltransferase
MTGTLYLVATPIGNLEDITLRAIRILNESSIVLAEDTRNSKKLFLEHKISSKLVSYNDFSSQAKISSIIKHLKEGKNISLISDAGTPLVSDPGHELVSQVISDKIRIESIPGPSSVISGLITSGFKNNKFIFEGFLPKKNNELMTLLSIFNHETRTIVCFESPHRIRKTLRTMRDVLDKNRKISIAREITKIHETILRGTIEEMGHISDTDSNLSRGELVIVLEGSDKEYDDFDRKLDYLHTSLSKDISLKQFSKVFSKISNQSAKEIYNKYKESV